jgi:hypothetical protein
VSQAIMHNFNFHFILEADRYCGPLSWASRHFAQRVKYYRRVTRLEQILQGAAYRGCREARERS